MYYKIITKENYGNDKEDWYNERKLDDKFAIIYQCLEFLKFEGTKELLIIKEEKEDETRIHNNN